MKVHLRILSRFARITVLRGLILLVPMLLGACSLAAQGPDYGNPPLPGNLPLVGGPGGGYFRDVCGAGTILTGFSLHAADDVDAIGLICTDASGNLTPPPSLHGGSGGSLVVLECRGNYNGVVGLDVGAEGQKTFIVNNLHLLCGTPFGEVQPGHHGPSFDGPYANYSDPNRAPLLEIEHCPAGQIAIGIHGRSGIWLDAVGLVCDRPRFTPVLPFVYVPQDKHFTPQSKTATGNEVAVPARVVRGGTTANEHTVTSLGRVTVPAPIPICDAARAARLRLSPAAANLEAQCRAAGGDPAYPGGHKPAH